MHLANATETWDILLEWKFIAIFWDLCYLKIKSLFPESLNLLLRILIENAITYKYNKVTVNSDYYLFSEYPSSR